MAGNYCQEFNRTIPHQTEGPEYTPYINKGTVAEKPKGSSLLAALLAAAAALAALLLPLCFSVQDVQSYSAQLYYQVTEEYGFQETDLVTSQLLFRGEVVQEDTLAFGEDTLPLDNLRPDSRYTLKIFKNDDPVKTLYFRTTPGDPLPPQEPVPPPPVQPAPLPEPPVEEPPIEEPPVEEIPEEPQEEELPEEIPEEEPEEEEEDTPTPPPLPPYHQYSKPVDFKPMTLNSLKAALDTDKTGANITWSVTPNRSEDIVYNLYQDGILIYTGTSHSRHVPDLSIGKHEFLLIIQHYFNGTRSTIADSVSITIPVKTLTIDSLTAELGPENTAFVSWSVTPNASKVTDYTLYMDNRQVYTGAEQSCEVPGLTPGAHTFRLTARYTTNGTSGSAQKSTSLTVPSQAVPLTFDSLTAEEAGPLTALLQWSVTPNDSQDISFDVYRDGEVYEPGVTGSTYLMTDLMPGPNTFQVTVNYTTGGTAGSQSRTVTIDIPEPPEYPDFDYNSLELVLDASNPENPLLWMSIDVLPGDADPSSISVTASAQGRSLTAQLSSSGDWITATIQNQPFPVTAEADILTVTLTLRSTVAGLPDQFSVDMPCDIVTE